MMYIEPSRFTDPDAAARKLVEIDNASEAVRENRICVELVKAVSSAWAARRTSSAAASRGVELGWLWRHESGTYLKFTPAGAELFA